MSVRGREEKFSHLGPGTGSVGTSNEGQRRGRYELSQGAEGSGSSLSTTSLPDGFSATNCGSPGQLSLLGRVTSDPRKGREVRTAQTPACELPNQERRREERKFLTRHLSCWRLRSSPLSAKEVRAAESPRPCECLFRNLRGSAAAPGTDMVSRASGEAVRGTLGGGIPVPRRGSRLRCAGAEGRLRTVACGSRKAAFPPRESQSEAGFRASSPQERVSRLDGVDRSWRFRRQFLRVRLDAPPCTEAGGGHPVTCFVTARLIPSCATGFLIEPVARLHASELQRSSRLCPFTWVFFI